MQAPSSPPADPDLVSRVAAEAATLLQQAGAPGFYPALAQALARFVAYDNFIVYRFERTHRAELLNTNIDEAELRAQMDPYIRGLYLLDPFVVASAALDRSTFHALDEIAPEEFTSSEFFATYYKNVDIVDEARFLVRLSADEFVHVFVEREREKFTVQDRSLLRAFTPLVAAAVERHRRDMDEQPPAPPAFDLRAGIASMQDGALTDREVDIVELMLMGHSSKSIGRKLNVAEGTVTNHKRNIYAKLELHSQSQLFHACLQHLVGGPLG